MTAPALPLSRAAGRMENPLVRAAVIVLAGLFVYAPVFSGGWLMDDNLEVTENAVLHSPAGLVKIWQGSVGADYLPLKTTVQWLLWQGFGNDPTPYHLASIALHLCSALLFWRLLAGLGLRQAWVGGLLFAVHPVEVESVAWVSELKNTLSLALLLPAMLAWLSFDERRRGRDYAWSLALFVAALLCKSSVIMWPVVILLHVWWKRGRVGWRDVVASLPFFAVAFAAGATTVLLQSHRAIRTEVYPLGGVLSRLALAGMDIAFYGWKTLFPVGLLPMYPRWRIDPPSAVEFLPWFILAALGSWLWTKRHAAWGRAVFLGLGFFLVNLLPVLGFFKMSFMRIAWVSDHFVYLPSLGLIGLIAAGLSRWYDRLEDGKRAYLRMAGWVGLGCLAMAGRLHAEVYSSLEAMSRYTVEANPDAWLAHQLYATTVQQKGDFDTALAQAAEAVRLRPSVAETQNSLGIALSAKGRYQEAAVHLQEAVRLAPQIRVIRESLARSLTAAGQYTQALQEYRQLLQEAPQDPTLHSNAGACLLGQGHTDEAIDQFRQALAIRPDLQSVSENLAIALRQREGEKASSSASP